jgi:ABC-2 type transport system ATP-binding protein
MTIIRPTRCTGTLLGEPVGTKHVLSRVGYLPEHLRFPDYLTGEQALHIYGALAKVPRQTRLSRMDELLDLVGMQDWRKKKIGTYSKGMKQRIGMAQALMNDPDLVLLDEPTDGVDPMGRRDIREMMSNIRRRGKAVFVNSHILAELEMVCDRVAILSKGDVVAQGTVEDLTRGSKRYEIQLASPMPEVARVKEVMGALNGDYMGSETKASITIPTDDTKAVQPLIDALRQSGAIIQSLKPVRQSLEDYFIEAVKESEGANPKPGAAQPKRR